MKNIVESYKWTTTTGSYIKEAPRVFATAYTTDTNAIFNTIEAYFTIAKAGVGASVNPLEYYGGLHQTTDQERYVFPFFGDELRNFNNSWGDSYVGSTNGSNTGTDYVGKVKDLAGNGINLMGQVNAMAQNKPGALFEPPKFYQYNQDEGGVSVSFNLINTENEGDAEDNYKLVRDLINDNRFKRDDKFALLVTPPKLWSVIIPGYRAIRWASCNVSVSMLGMRRYINGKLIPEGYNVLLTFTPLYTEPSNFDKYYQQEEFKDESTR